MRMSDMNISYQCTKSGKLPSLHGGGCPLTNDSYTRVSRMGLCSFVDINIFVMKYYII